MRPVNLIPAEQRRGEQAPLRTGALVYLVVGAFVAILVGVTAMVLLGNKIADRESEVTQLQREDAVVSAQAQRLASYTQFKILSEQRVQTVSSLADSRFDWERVMRELSLILPSDVWLVDLTATAAPGVSVSGGSSGGGLRSSAPGPALELNGCATGQQSVAGFVTSLKDIDGVTRVGVESSEVAGKESGAGVSAGGESGSGGAGEDCRTRDFIAKFQIVVAFDAAPVPITSSTEAAAPAPPAEEAESSAASEETAGS
jgi:Tfp pilus assembly protein PilN